MNPAGLELFGYTADELTDEPLTVLMPERFREMHERGMSRFLASGEAKVIGRTVELVGLRRDESELALSAFEKEGSVSFTGLICDISGDGCPRRPCAGPRSSTRAS